MNPAKKAMAYDFFDEWMELREQKAIKKKLGCYLRWMGRDRVRDILIIQFVFAETSGSKITAIIF